MNTIKGRLFQFQHGCFEEIGMVSRVFFCIRRRKRRRRILVTMMVLRF